ncbi:Bracovirus particle protein HzNVorf64-like (p51) [Microplitis demolitor]|uniref:Bracovirus particle protein HzNVorf64-like (p51) n=1 Tax=Microplitis demolitor TaxID=69319 RepID=UPI000440020D|nr:Bracovirus particle protein HzNVorf64-like (p51) [Microplitis demolitor]KAG6558457.1 Bracovirus particle protein HzNVorf64-like (p51) [Microplitis demolitor]
MDIKNFELVLGEDKPKGIIVKDLDNNVIENITIPEDDEFTFNNVRYIVFENLLSLRQHYSTFEYDDMAIKEFSIIKRTSAEKILTWIATIHQHSLEYRTVPTMSSITDALQTISEELKLQADDATADSNLKEMFNVFLNLLNDLIKEITSEQLAIIYQYSNIAKLQIGDLPLSTLLKISSEYLYNLLFYKENMIERVSLTYPMQMLSYVMRIFLLLFSCFNIPFTDDESILIHEITAILIDLLSDRLTTNVYLKHGNSYATGIMQKINRKFPSLANVTDINKVDQFVQNNPDFKSFIETNYRDFNLWPFVLSMNMTRQQRIMFNIKACLDNFRLKDKNKIDIQPKEVIELVEQICEPYVQTKQYERYNEVCFKQIVNSTLFSKICNFMSS